MPAPYRPGGRPYPGSGNSLADAARQGLVLVCRCNGCRKTVRYWASDLAALHHDPGSVDYLDPLMACPGCGSTEFIRVNTRSPQPGDFGHLYVCRPGPIIAMRNWYFVKMGDEVPERPAGERNAGRPYLKALDRG